MRKLIFILLIQLTLTSCGGGDTVILEPELELGNFELIFPKNNTLCTEGSVLSNNEISILLKWNASKNAASYKIVITNTSTGKKIEKTTITNSVQVVLLKGTKFSWKVIAVLKDKTKLSNSWNFYSEGVSVSNHIPFPASITLNDNKDGTIKINWEGTDIDNDIKNYKIYLGNSESTVVLIEETEKNTIEKQSINYNEIYFLKIITIDKKGNSSSSIKKFKFNN